MSNYLDDIAQSDQSTIESKGPQYSFIQYVNGKPDRKPIGGIPYTGGWFIPADNAPAEMPQPWVGIELTHSTGGSTPGWARRDLKVAVIRSRFSWFYKDASGATIRVPRNGFSRDYQMRGHLQVLVGIAGLSDPYVLTLKGTASKSFEEQVQLFDRYILGAANAQLAAAKKQARSPRYAFWLILGPQRDDKKEPVFKKVGQGNDTSMVTLMTSDAGNRPATPEELEKKFVGAELRAKFQEWYLGATEWVSQWNQGETASDHWYKDPRWKGKFDVLAEELGMDESDILKALHGKHPLQFAGSYDEACVLLRDYVEQYPEPIMSPAQASGFDES